MSGRVMKGFLVFTVVFFFAVVGLVGLTVVMKRHENAQIAEEDKTLVAPDPQKIQRLVDGIDFVDDMSSEDKNSVKQTVMVLLKVCPRMVNLAGNNATFRVSEAYGFDEWRGTGARWDLLIDLKNNEMKNVSIRFKGEKGLAEYGLRGGEPGALVIWPFSRWLCNVPSKMTYHEMNEALDKKEVTYKDLIQFIPLKDIPPNSF